MSAFHQRKFRGCSFDYFIMIRLREMKEWHPLILVCIPTCLSSDHVITSGDM